LKACPVVLLTVDDDVQKGRAMGAAGHLMKPINRDVLLRTLERCCALSHGQDEGQGYEQVA
jgi:FixJ family two-component response regulator